MDAVPNRSSTVTTQENPQCAKYGTDFTKVDSDKINLIRKVYNARAVFPVRFFRARLFRAAAKDASGINLSRRYPYDQILQDG